MLITVGPLIAAGMPLQRVPGGFIGKRMRSSSHRLEVTVGFSDSNRASLATRLTPAVTTASVHQ